MDSFRSYAEILINRNILSCNRFLIGNAKLTCAAGLDDNRSISGKNTIRCFPIADAFFCCAGEAVVTREFYCKRLFTIISYRRAVSGSFDLSAIQLQDILIRVIGDGLISTNIPLVFISDRISPDIEIISKCGL